jgi:hypothetical protein
VQDEALKPLGGRGGIVRRACGATAQQQCKHP